MIVGVAGKTLEAMRLKPPKGRPGLGVKLLLLGVPLALFVPWMAYLLVDEVERLSVQMQSNQQRLIAESIAISLHGREDLFTDLPVSAGEDARGSVQSSDLTLVARPIQNPLRPRLDGSVADWGEQAVRPMFFGAENSDASFALSLGTRGGMLYLYLDVTDDVRVYRNPEVLRLNNADQVRLGFIEPNGDDGRIAVTLSESGATTAYRMDSDWRFAEDGQPERDVQGYVRTTSAGHAVELRMPYSILGSQRFFELSFVDVDDADGRAIRGLTATGDSTLVAYRSPELLGIVEGLGYSDMRILVVDAERRIRVDTGTFRTSGAAQPESSWQGKALAWLIAAHNVLQRWFGDESSVAAGDAAAQRIENEVKDSVLAGEPIARRRRTGDVETVLAGHHIVSAQGSVIGMVSVEQNIDDILLLQYEAIDRIALVSVASFFIVPLCLVAFAGRLAWRIGSLRREAGAAIDDYGRLRSDTLARSTAAGDEIGDLARSISNMLARLDQRNTFLKKMPRTLRHEINNPLNTLNTSLEHLSVETPSVRDSKYLDSARRGVLRIGAIVQNLADAANLEESLTSEEMETVDIQALLASYVGNCRTAHPEHAFVYLGTVGPVYANVADFRIEQLLDKLIDNAVDFHRRGSPITVQLDVKRENLRIAVANRGPTLPTDAAGSLFESMVSRRGSDANLHFGLGLYVVRVIAEQHGGSAHAANLIDGSGVAVCVRLPLADAPSSSLSVRNGRAAAKADQAA